MTFLPLVRIEGVRGSNPLSSTEFLQVRRPVRVSGSRSGSQCGSQGVGGQTKAEVKDQLKALHSELDAGLRTAQGYTVEKAVADWLDEGLPGRTVKTVEANRDSLRPLLAVIGRIPLKNLIVQDVWTALRKMAATHATRTLRKAHNCLTRAVRHAEGQDLVRRNVSALVDTPRGLEGRIGERLEQLRELDRKKKT